MFATLRCSSDEESMVAIQETTELPPQGQGHQHQACHQCREKKLKCSAQKTGCDRCVAQGIVCTFRPPGRRQDNRSQQKRNGSTAVSPLTRRSEPTRASASSKSKLPPASVHEANQPQINDNPGTLEASTPALTRDDFSVSSRVGSTSTPQDNGQSQGNPDNMWRMSSMGSGNASLAPSLNGTDFDLSRNRSLIDLDNFSGDTGFDAYGIEQDDDRFSDIMEMDLDFSCPDFMTKDELNLSTSEKPSAIKRLDTRVMASPLPSSHNSRMTPQTSSSGSTRGTLPSQPLWGGTHRSHSISSHHSISDDKSSFRSKLTQCDCLAITLFLLEKVHFREPPASASTLMRLLHGFKQWINPFERVASCNTCNCGNESLMLLIVVCEKLADSFTIVLTVYEKLAEAMVETSGTPEMRMLSNEYSIDSIEEFVCLFKSLALRHLQALHIIVMALDKKAVLEKLMTHHELLQKLHDRQCMMKQTLRQAHMKGS